MVRLMGRLVPAQLLDLLLGELLGGLLRLPRGLLRLALDLVRGRARARIGVRVRVRVRVMVRVRG